MEKIKLKIKLVLTKIDEKIFKINKYSKKMFVGNDLSLKNIENLKK